MRRFVVHGEPVAKGRPRFNRYTGRAFTPEKTINYENLVKMEYLQAYPDEKPYSSDTALNLRVDIYVSIPKSVSKKKRQEMLNNEVRPTKKPDLDNCIKVLADSGNGVIWEDDKCIVDIVARKWYSDTPRVEIRIDEATALLPFDEEI